MYVPLAVCGRKAEFEERIDATYISLFLLSVYSHLLLKRRRGCREHPLWPAEKRGAMLTETDGQLLANTSI